MTRGYKRKVLPQEETIGNWEQPVPEPLESTQADLIAKQEAEAQVARHQQLIQAHQLGLNVQAATFTAAINQMMELCNSWFTHVQGFDRQNFDGDCMLVTTELAEAVEGDRKRLRDEHCPEFDSREVEIADALVRILHLAAKYQLRLAPAFIAKQHFNLTRPVKHGKGY